MVASGIPTRAVVTCSMGSNLTALAAQVSTGPRMESDEPGGAEALRLWSLQLGFLCRFARDPITALYPPEYLYFDLSTQTPGPVAGKPLLDAATGTHGVTAEEVDSFVARAARWLLHGSANALAGRQADSVLEALCSVHPSMVRIVLHHVKQAGAEQLSAQTHRDRSLFSSVLGSREPAKDAALEPSSLYHLPRVLQLLARLYSKTPPHDLCQSDERGRLVHQLAVNTLEEVCSLWLHRPRSASLQGPSLQNAASVMNTYLRFVAAKVAPSGSVSISGAGGESGSRSSGSGDGGSGSTSSAAAMAANAGVPIGFMKQAFVLLRSWMAVALSDAGGALANSQRSDMLLDACSEDEGEDVPSLSGEHSEGSTSSSASLLATVSADDSAEVAVLSAVEALVLLHSFASSAQLGATVSSSLPPSENGSITSTAFVNELRLFVEEAVLTWASLQHSACRVLATMLSHQPSLLPLFLHASLRGHATPPSMNSSGVSDDGTACTPRDGAAVSFAPPPPSGRDAAAMSTPSLSTRGAEDDTGGTHGHRHTLSSSRSRRHTNAPLDAHPTRDRQRTRTMTALSIASSVQPPSSFGGLAGDDTTGLLAEDMLARESTLAYVYFSALVRNCSQAMKRWHNGIEARLLFLSLLHQTSEHSRQRDLALRLSLALAASPCTGLVPQSTQAIPWLSSRVPMVDTAAPFRYSSALAPHHIELLPALMEECVDRESSRTNRARAGRSFPILLPHHRPSPHPPPPAPLNAARCSLSLAQPPQLLLHLPQAGRPLLVSTILGSRVPATAPAPVAPCACACL